MRAGRRALTVLESHASGRLTGMHVQTLTLLSAIYQEVADYGSSQSLLHRVLTLLPPSSSSARRTAVRVDTFIRLGNLARLEGKYQLAERHLREALRLVDSRPDQAGGSAGARNALAITMKDCGRFDEAAALYQDVLSDVLARLGPQSSAAASGYHNLAGLAYARGDHHAAETLARTAVNLRTRLLGDRHPAVAADLAVLGAVLLAEHKLDQAEDAYGKALTIYARVFGTDHYEIAVTLNGLATIESERDRLDLAARLYRRALVIKERVLGPQHPEIGVLLNNLALVYRKAEQIDAAADCYERAIAILRNSLGDAHPSVVASSNNLAAMM